MASGDSWVVARSGRDVTSWLAGAVTRTVVHGSQAGWVGCGASSSSSSSSSSSMASRSL
jgi:hypothetical protein